MTTTRGPNPIPASSPCPGHKSRSQSPWGGKIPLLHHLACAWRSGSLNGGRFISTGNSGRQTSLFGNWLPRGAGTERSKKR